MGVRVLDSLRNIKAQKAAQPASWFEFSHLILAGLFGGIAIALVALAAWLLGEPVDVFTREPQQVLNGSFYVGSFSNLGGVIWFASAAIMSFAAILKPAERGGLVLAALLTWAMGLDDIFMLHDRVYPKLFLSEHIVVALYFITIAVIFVRFHRQLSRSTLIGIVITVGFWGLSGVLDLFFNRMGGQLVEDGTKFLGLVVWAAAWVRQAYDDVAGLVQPRT